MSTPPRESPTNNNSQISEAKELDPNARPSTTSLSQGTMTEDLRSGETKDAAATRMSALSDLAILQHMIAGTVVIEPFRERQLNTSSYDVTLGEYYFRETRPTTGDGEIQIYNPYSETMVRRVWGACQTAERVGDIRHKYPPTALENIHDDERVIFINPGETILGHTLEFIGGRGTVTTMMKARSSVGRNFIEVCKCAGWGDVGYINRWTMEITNNSHYTIPLVVGRRIAQIVFFDTDGTLRNRSYADGGKYQTTRDFALLVKDWNPQSCLPKMYMDSEIQRRLTETEPETEGKSSVEQARALLEKHKKAL